VESGSSTIGAPGQTLSPGRNGIYPSSRHTGTKLTIPAEGAFNVIFDKALSARCTSNAAFWRASIFVGAGEEGHLPMWVEFAPLTVTIIGFAIAYYYYILHPDLPKKLADRKGMLYLFLYNKWYFDELYDLLFVRPAMRLGCFLWKRGDGTVIDGLGPDGIAARVLDASRGAVRDVDQPRR